MSTRMVDASPAADPPPVAVAGSPVAGPRRAAARRRSSRKSLVASVLVVLLGGLLALLAGRMLTEHSQVLAVARAVPVGATLTAADLTVASVTSDPNLSPVPADQQSRIVGLVAQVPLVRGELLTRAQVGTGDGLGPGEMLVALPLKGGQFPARGLTPGQRVLLVTTPGKNGAVPSASGGPGASSGRQFTARVAEVGQPDASTQVTVVDVRVGSQDGPAVAALASTGDLALVLLPVGR